MIAVKPKIQEPAASVNPNKDAARECLRSADKFLRDGDFEKAKAQVDKAKELDPSNPYIPAFQDRIDYFQEQKKKEAIQPKSQLPKLTPPPVSPPTVPLTPSHMPEQTVVKSVEVENRSKGKQYTPAESELRETKAETESMLLQMKRQIEELSHALEQEKKAREEISSRQLQSAVKQLQTAYEKAWVNGAPPEKEAQALHQLALSLAIPEEVEQSVLREVKLDMYSRAVKEVVSKRKLLKSSSSTMEWLRKVYQVSLTEYLENESKFLLDLVADQYKGTLLFITSDANAKKDLAGRLKTTGYAVVMVPSPETALEKVEKINPNVILCEMEFPNGSLSGIKFLHVLRASSKFNFFPFVLLCEAKDVSQLQSSELRPNEGYVKKPVDFDELSAVMNEKLLQFREYISSLA